MQAKIYFPADEKIKQQLDKELAAFHCAAILKYMDFLQLDENRQTAVIDSLLKDAAANSEVSE